MEETAIEAERLAERRALGAEPAMIGRMVGIAADRRPAVTVMRSQLPGISAEARIAVGF